MERFIQRITGVIPHTHKSVDIELNGKNLIVTGANGSGKTSLVRDVYEKIYLLVAQKQGSDLPVLKQQMIELQNALQTAQKGTTSYDSIITNIKYRNEKIDAIENGLSVSISDTVTFSSLYDDKKAVIYFFEESHLSNITSAATPTALTQAEEKARKQNPTKRVGNDLEQHLLNLANRRQWAQAHDNDNKKVQEIDAWFIHFERQMKKLFEDDSAHLEIDSNSLKYQIIQDSKPPYDFQHLSAGYKAIFDVYAELLMRTEYFKVMPKDLSGAVFIDEIDVHLHVSLQRLILPFFAESFPNIQFIVTTHSPFVLMSTTDTVVFDLAQNEPITEDLSYYTYSAIMEGLWHVKPIAVSLEHTIQVLADMVNAESKDIDRIRELVGKIGKYEQVLNAESKVFFLRGLETLQEYENHV